MNRLAAAAMAFLALHAASDAQAAMLKGVVLADDLGGPPVAGAVVGAVDSEVRTTTDAHGAYTLLFPPNRGAGETVKLQVHKDGHEVVHELQLEQTLVEDPKGPPRVILLCRAGNRDEMAQRHFSWTAFEVLREGYRRQLKALSGQQGETWAQGAQLRRQLDQAEAAIPFIARSLARTNAACTSSLCRQAMRSLLEGKLDRALEGFERQAGEDSRGEEAGDALEVKNWPRMSSRDVQLKGHLLALSLRFSDAERSYRSALELDREDLDLRFDHAAFLRSLRRMDEARARSLECLEMAERGGNASRVADAWLLVATAHSDAKGAKEAGPAFEKAIRMYRDPAAGDAEACLPRLAAAWNELAAHHRRQSAIAEAANAHAEAAKIYRPLSDRNPEAFGPPLAMTLHNLSAAQRAIGQPEDARKTLEEALKIRRAMAARSPDRYLPEVASTLEDLSVLLRELNRAKEVRKVYEESVKLYRQLATRDPERYLLETAVSLNRLGAFHREGARDRDARKAYGDAVKVYRELAAREPSTYLPYVASSQVHLAIFHQEQNRVKEAVKGFQEALKTYRGLAASRPETYSPYVALTLSRLGDLYRLQNQGTSARKAYEEAVKTLRLVASNSRQAPARSDLATALIKLGASLRDERLMEEAVRAFDEGLAVYRELAPSAPDVHLPNVVKALNNLGIAHQETGQFEEALEAFEEALAVCADEAFPAAGSYEPCVAMTLNNLGGLHRAQKRLDEAGKTYKKSLSLCRGLANRNPAVYLPYVAGTLGNLGILYRDQNRLEEAAKAFEEALAVYRGLSEQEPDRFTADAARIESFLSTLHNGARGAQGD